MSLYVSKIVYIYFFKISNCLCVRHGFQTHNICTANTLHYYGFTIILCGTYFCINSGCL